MNEHAPLRTVVGNPKPRSRTRSLAEAVAERLAGDLGFDVDRGGVATTDLADVAGELFDWGSETVRGHVDAVSGASLVVVASPTYKASYTGLLKAFLDWFDQRSLDGVLAVPVMVGGAPHHALAVELHLRPLLVEIGAMVPSRGLYVLERDLEDPMGTIDGWAETAVPSLRRSLA